jgi:hypothetical protein
MLSEASAATPGRSGSAPAGSRRPVISGRATLDELLMRFEQAIAEDDEAEVVVTIDWAEAQIRLVTHGPDREPETKEQFRFRLCSDYEGRPARFVADRERISIALVRKIRAEENRDPRTGRDLPEKRPKG